MIGKQIKHGNIFLTLGHYKEPMMKIKKKDGFGFYGALLNTIDGKYVQCHICGKLFQSLSCHVRMHHKMDCRDYREKFQLAYTTALISEKERERMKQTTIDWLKNLSEKEKQDMKQFAIKKSSEARKGKKIQPKLTLESYNKRGTCPEQLIQQILNVSTMLNRTPSLAEFIEYTHGQRYKHLIFKVYGSWKNALKIAGLNPKKRQNGKRIIYSDEELLDYLKIFGTEFKKEPMTSDCNRGLLPDWNIYKRRFGSFTKAKELAEVIY